LKGGAMDIGRVQLKLINCGFFHNSASNYGGALSFKLCSDMNFTNTSWVRNFVTNCDDVDNSGGAFHIIVDSGSYKADINNNIYLRNLVISVSGCSCLFFLYILFFISLLTLGKGNDARIISTEIIWNSNNITDSYSNSDNDKVFFFNIFCLKYLIFVFRLLYIQILEMSFFLIFHHRILLLRVSLMFQRVLVLIILDVLH
jgi:hypothetical protein